MICPSSEVVGLLRERYKVPFEFRLWAYVEIRGSAECWPWHGAKTAGYGVTADRHGRQTRAHRLAWEAANRSCLLPGFVVMHRCDNPTCCNPAHLEVGTRWDNIQDMRRKGRGHWNRTGPSNKMRGHALDATTVRIIRESFDSGVFTQGELCRIYNVSAPNMSLIVRRLSWRHVK